MACRSAPKRRKSSRSTSRSSPPTPSSTSSTRTPAFSRSIGRSASRTSARRSTASCRRLTAASATPSSRHGAPLDICVMTEKLIPRGDIILLARPIGGLRMIDHGEADDKIVAVLEGDASYGAWRDVHQMPKTLIDRLRHYFLTYKAGPDTLADPVEITHVYDRDEAHEVIRRSQQDYRALFPELSG